MVHAYKMLFLKMDFCDLFTSLCSFILITRAILVFLSVSLSLSSAHFHQCVFGSIWNLFRVFLLFFVSSALFISHCLSSFLSLYFCFFPSHAHTYATHTQLSPTSLIPHLQLFVIFSQFHSHSTILFLSIVPHFLSFAREQLQSVCFIFLQTAEKKICLHMCRLSTSESSGFLFSDETQNEARKQHCNENEANSWWEACLMIGLACLCEFFIYAIADEMVYQYRAEWSLRGLLRSGVVVVVVVAQINPIFLAVHLIAYQGYFGIRT